MGSLGMRQSGYAFVDFSDAASAAAAASVTGDKLTALSCEYISNLRRAMRSNATSGATTVATSGATTPLSRSMSPAIDASAVATHDVMAALQEQWEEEGHGQDQRPGHWHGQEPGQEQWQEQWHGQEPGQSVGHRVTRATPPGSPPRFPPGSRAPFGVPVQAPHSGRVAAHAFPGAFVPAPAPDRSPGVGADQLQWVTPVAPLPMTAVAYFVPAPTHDGAMMQVPVPRPYDKRYAAVWDPVGGFTAAFPPFYSPQVQIRPQPQPLSQLQPYHAPRPAPVLVPAYGGMRRSSSFSSA